MPRCKDHAVPPFSLELYLKDFWNTKGHFLTMVQSLYITPVHIRLQVKGHERVVRTVSAVTNSGPRSLQRSSSYSGRYSRCVYGGEMVLINPFIRNGLITKANNILLYCCCLVFFLLSSSSSCLLFMFFFSFNLSQVSK